MKESPRVARGANLFPQISGPLLVFGAIAILELLSWGTLKIPNPPAILLLIVVFSAFIGGVRSGLVAALIAWGYFAYFFSIPGHPFQHTTENFRRVLVWAVTTPAMAIMVGILKDRTEGAVAISRENAELAEQIAERKQAEQALHESEGQYRTLFERIPVGLIRTSPEGTILDANPGLVEMLGFPNRDELLTANMNDLYVNSQERQEARAQVERAGDVSGLELHLRRHDGTPIWVRANGRVIRDAAGRVLEYEGAMVDVTDRKRADDIRLQLATIVESSEDAILSRTLDGTILSWNSGSERMYGYSAQEAIGQPVALLVPPNCLSEIPDFLGRLRRGERVGHHETVRVRKDGTRIEVSLTVSPIRDTAGTIIGISTISRDISERKRTEQALKESEARNSAILRGALDGIITMDQMGRILEFNPAAETTFGYRRDDVLGRELVDFIIPQALRDQHRGGLAHYFATGESAILDKRIEVTALRATGEEFPVELSVIRIPSSGPPTFSGFVRDITERKRAEDEIHTLNRKLEERVQQRTAQLETANQELEAFSYSVAHDLRSPLITIGGFSQMLIEDHAAALPEDARRLAVEIAASTQHMSGLINDLLALSQLGRQPIKAQPVSPADIARQAMAELNGTRGGRAAGIRIGDLPRCQADPGLLRQVYVNLLSNALKFSRNREDAVIEVGWRPDLNEPAYHTYFVKDNGAGFDMQYGDKLFRIFQRLHRQEEYEGTGVGLAIVQRIIHRHGGRVWAESEVGKGATFYFTLARSDVT